MHDKGLGYIDVFAAGARVAVGFALLIAGAAKLASIRTFAALLETFPIARSLVHNSRQALPAAFALVIGESCLGFLFILGIEERVVALLIVALLLAFTAALALAIARGERISCGCFGSASDEAVDSLNLYRNAMLLGAAALGATSSPLTVEGYLAGQSSLGDVLTSAAIGAQGGLLALYLIAHARLRRSPNYVKRVPRPYTSIDSIWEGAPLR